MKIKIIQNDDVEKLEKELEKYISQNWEIVGNISISSCYDPRCTDIIYTYVATLKKI